MKKIFNYILIAGVCFGLASCDKFFDDMEGDLSKVAAEDLQSSENGMLALLANLYSNLPGMSMSDNDKYQMFGNAARDVPDYKNTTPGFWDYKTIRAVHKFMEVVESAEKSGAIDEDKKNAYMGEALFLRACFYFANVRTHGGIPIVDKALDDEYTPGGDNQGLYYPRKTEKDSWDWVLGQFDEAIKLLPESQGDKSLRANKYTAYAMKARAALWAASESKYWNRVPISSSYEAVQKKLTYMEASYADGYYKQAIDAADAVIKSGVYSLYGGIPNDINAAIGNLNDLFQSYQFSEGIFGRSYKTGDSETTNGTDKWVPNQFAVGYTGTGAANYAATLNLADEYDYYDDENTRNRKSGKIATLHSGDEDDYLTDPQTQFTADKVSDYVHYNSVQEPFLLKDARFQAWVMYPGCTFRGITVYMEGGMVKPDGSVSVYPNSDASGSGNIGVDKNDVTYYPYGGAGINNSAFMGLLTDKNSNNRNSYCFSPRKFLDQNSANQYVQSPYYDIRYAEVLLTYAEAVCESGQGDKAQAKKCLNDIRHRAGFRDDVELTLENILHEWKVEFAFENKWSNVLYRRRGFYNPTKVSNPEEGTLGKKLTLIPMVDLSGAKAQWIFLRALPMTATSAWGYSGTLSFSPEDYYAQIPHYVENKIEPNNK